MVKIVFGFAIVVLLLAAAAAVFLAYRNWRQHRTAEALAIHAPNGIDEAMFVRIGGIDQWVQIRGEDRSNPVILVLHGGMAMSYLSFTPALKPWEKHFTVVQWDRRGVGKTFGRNGAKGSGEMSLNRIADDGIELSELLRTRLHKRKIILLGHSMGSQIGITMAARRPDLFHAYVACEQIIDMKSNEAESYRLILKGLHEHGDAKAASRLERLGPPPYAKLMDWGRKQQAAESADPTYGKLLNKQIWSMVFYSPAYSVRDLFDFIGGMRFSGEKLFSQWMAFDAHKLGNRFGEPIVVIQGEGDVMTPTPLVLAWLDGVEAPKKEMVAMPGGHLAMLTQPEAFLQVLVEKVRPLAAEAS